MDTLTWVILIIVVLVLAGAAVLIARKVSERRTEGKRGRAAELREQASATQRGIREKQAEADETAARAKAARAEADRQQAEAKKLEARAADKRSTLSEHVQRRDELLQEADRIDPDASPTEDSGKHADTDTEHRV
ncbi:MAG: hypothetical protein ACJ716_10035 [Marmoricola sp.]